MWRFANNLRLCTCYTFIGNNIITGYCVGMIERNIYLNILYKDRLHLTNTFIDWNSNIVILITVKANGMSAIIFKWIGRKYEPKGIIKDGLKQD